VTNNELKFNTLKRRECLKSSVRITAILRSDRRLKGRCLSLYFAPAEDMAFAVLVNKKVGSAVQRNKTKRWIREIYRQEKHNILFPCELILLVDKQFSFLSFNTLKTDIKYLISKLNKKKP